MPVTLHTHRTAKGPALIALANLYTGSVIDDMIAAFNAYQTTGNADHLANLVIIKATGPAAFDADTGVGPSTSNEVITGALHAFALWAAAETARDEATAAADCALNAVIECNEAREALTAAERYIMAAAAEVGPVDPHALALGWPVVARRFPDVPTSAPIDISALQRRYTLATHHADRARLQAAAAGKRERAAVKRCKGVAGLTGDRALDRVIVGVKLGAASAEVAAIKARVKSSGVEQAADLGPATGPADLGPATGPADLGPTTGPATGPADLGPATGPADYCGMDF